MRAGSGVFVAVAVSIVLMVSACGSSAPPTPAPNLFGEYVRSTNVKNDKFPSSRTSEDRLANFAAFYTPEQLQFELLSAFPCATKADCDLNGAVSKAIQDFAGPDRAVFGRSILVKHQNGSLELITLYVVRKSDNTVALIDATGKTYIDGLDDFRQNNDLLSSDDLIHAPRDITSIPGEGEIVTVSGPTPRTGNRGSSAESLR